ncbi:MAG: MFS transporter [Coriobacteriales bacterium]|nr:MFS transporter [Coriobacteriales bacterium]
MKRMHARLWHRLAIVLAVACALASVASFGITLPSTLLSPVVLDGPTAFDSDGTLSVVVDSESKHALILNKDHHLTGMVDCNVLNSPLESVTDVCVSNGTVYLAGVVYEKDSDIIEHERVVAYPPSGRNGKVVYECEDTHYQLPAIKTLDNGEDGVNVVLVRNGTTDTSYPALEIVYAQLDGTKMVSRSEWKTPLLHDVGYSSTSNVIQALSMRGTMEDMVRYGSNPSKSIWDEPEFESLRDHVFTSLDVADDGTTYLYDDVTNSVYRLLDDGTLQSVLGLKGCSCLHINGSVMSLCDHVGNSVGLCKLDGSGFEELSTIELSAALKMLVALVVGCACYLCLFFVVELVLKVRSLIRQGQTEGIGPMFASLAVVLVVTMAIAYISYGSYQAIVAMRANEINLFADYLDTTATQLSQNVQNCNDRTFLRDDDPEYSYVSDSLATLRLELGGLAYAATDNGVGTYVVLYGKDDQGIFYLYESSMEHVIGTSTDVNANHEKIEHIFETNQADDELHTGRSLYDETQYRLVRVPTSDGQQTAGVVEVGTRIKTFESSIARYQVQRIITLLVMVLVVYLTYCELRACARCFLNYGHMHDKHDAIAVLTRPFSFFVTLLSSIDAVMTTLIARSMLQAAGVSGSGVLLALPSVMLGIGLALGQAIYAVVGSRIIIRKLMIRGSVAMMVTAALAALAVASGVFWLYCLAKLAMAIPFGLLYTLSYSLPRRADSDEVRALAASGIKRTDTSAAALGTVLGGYVAQNLGNAWVYALVALASVIVLVMARTLLPRSKHPLEREIPHQTSPRQAFLTLLANKTTIPVILFVMLPAIVAAGYNSFLFPLYSANLGLETSSINNLFVLGQLVVYVSIVWLEGLEDRYGKWRIAGVSVALLGMVFLLLSLNTTLVWAVVSIALVGVLCKASDAWKALWPRSAHTVGLTAGIATGGMFAVRSVLLIVQPLLLGALLLVGDHTAVVVLGLICFVSAIAFYVLTRGTAISTK